MEKATKKGSQMLMWAIDHINGTKLMNKGKKEHMMGCEYRNKSQKSCWIVVKTMNFFTFFFLYILKLCESFQVVLNDWYESWGIQMKNSLN